MSRLYQAVQAALAKGPRTTEEVVAECRRSGLAVRPETVELFLRLSRDLRGDKGTWSRRGDDKADRILAALQQAFAGGSTYVPLERVARILGAGVPVTADDIDAVCQESGQYRRQGNYILRG
jgi:hypothetical protein